MKTKEITVAANLTYSGFTYNTKLFVEYEHTGAQFFKGNSHYTTDPEIAANWRAKGKKVVTKPGYYFIKRIAIPTILANGEPDKWYITNPGDDYTINRASKNWKKLHIQFSAQQDAN